MKIIQPHKVTAQLLDIIHEAEKELILVSPYVDFTSWQKPVAAIKSAMARNVKVTFYIRSNQESQASYDHVRRLGLNPVLVENLHAKMYLSEKDGILTSMNLLRYSDSNSIEIGTQVEQPAELEELHRIVHRFIAQQPSVTHTTPAPQPVAQPISVPIAKRFDESIEQYLREQVDSQAGVKWSDNSALRIAALGNSFTFELGYPANKAELYGIVSEREAEHFTQKRQKHFTDKDMMYSLLRRQGHYTCIRGVHTILLADRNLDKLNDTERQRLHHTIANFVRAVRAFKDDY